MQGMSSASVVLLPGLFAGAWIWDRTRTCLLAQGYQVRTVPDPLALLDLGSPLSDTLITDLRGYVSRYFDQGHIDKAVLCGNSLGALAALDFAFHFPKRVKALVISGAPGLPSPQNATANSPLAITVESAYAVADLLCYDRACLTDERIETTFKLLAHRKVLVNIARALRAARNYDVRGILPHLDCPVLMIWGVHDRVTPVEEWEHEIRLVKQGTLRKVHNCGHCPMLEQPNQFNALLLEFLNQCAEAKRLKGPAFPGDDDAHTCKEGPVG
jgi:pimeloyl-ACP methyl ester carboxylesterase